jgi:hypothetical protein
LQTTKAHRRRAQRQKKRREITLRVAPHRATSGRSGSVLKSADGWQQQGGRGLQQGAFYPELTLGAGALSGDRRSKLQDFLVAVIRQRDCPLHLANLWNAIYFNFDLGYGGFRADHLEQKRIPTREAEARAWSLPVGGFVRVHTAMGCGDLLAEVIYKEGAHPDVDDEDGWVDPALSGAPATVTEEVAGQPVSIVRERFVLDLTAFGPEGNTMTAKQYDRLCQRARWLDSHGHLLMEAMYGAEESELEDLDYYADYLMREHREGLLAFCFTEELSDDELREALLRSFDAVRDLALGARELRSWRSKYFFLESTYRNRLADSDAVLGGGDLQAVARGLMRVPTGSTRCYSAIRPRILEVLERDGLTLEEEANVRGSAYVAAVCHANSFVADTLADVQPTGVRADAVHLRLDDDWQGGGVWRAEQVTDPERYSLNAVPPTIPLGLGYAESRPTEADVDTPESAEPPIASSQRGFRVALTLRDRALGRLRLSPEAAAELADRTVDIAVRHGDVRERYAVERVDACLYGLHFPLAFHPGLVLHCNVESGGSVVRIRSDPVTPPLVASDGMSFDYDTDVAVYEREIGLKPLSASQRRDAPTLAELINGALRQRGRTRDDGGRALTLGEIATVILGPNWQAGETRPIAEAAAATGLARDGAEYVWYPRVTRRTRSTDRSLLAAYGESKASGSIARTVRRHWVPMHLRRFTEHSHRAPSSAKRASYGEARRGFGMYGVLPEVLPDGYTWVKPYSWGEDDTIEELVGLEIGVAPDGEAAIPPRP